MEQQLCRCFFPCWMPNKINNKFVCKSAVACWQWRTPYIFFSRRLAGNKGILNSQVIREYYILRSTEYESDQNEFAIRIRSKKWFHIRGGVVGASEQGGGRVFKLRFNLKNLTLIVFMTISFVKITPDWNAR